MELHNIKNKASDDGRFSIKCTLIYAIIVVILLFS